MSCPLLVLGSLVLAAAPPLTAVQRDQVATASDHSPVFDEGALYPLLANAADWPAGALPAGAAVPDYAELLAAPDAHRGGLFVIEGRLAATPRPFGTLSRPGPWDQTLRQWPIVIGDGNAPAEGEAVALVYLLDNPAASDLPGIGTRVRVAARFYKVWTSADLSGRSRDYLTFVGRRAQWEAGAAPQPWQTIVPLAGVVLGLLAVYLVLRRGLRPRATPRRGRPGGPTARDAAAVGPEYDSPSPLLPGDPAEAMAHLAGQADAAERAPERKTESQTDARR